MLATLLIVTLVFAVNVYSTRPELHPRVKRIIGGRASNISEYPWQAALEYGTKFTCGGSIHSSYFVITAAHCIENSSSLQVRVGSSLRGSRGSVHHVVRLAVHEKFHLNEYNNSVYDVAVLKLADPIQFDDFRRPIALYEGKLDPGINATATGWGWSSIGGERNEQLQSVQLTVISRKNCLEAYKNFGGLEEGEICARNLGNRIQSPCHGDSGGPLVVDGKLAGIIAHGENCGKSDYPEVFTEISHFRHWIEEKIRSLK